MLPHLVSDESGKIRIKLLVVFLFCLLIGSSSTLLYMARTQAAGQLTSASVAVSDTRPGTTGQGYNFTFTPQNTTAINTITLQYCTSPSGSCTAPTGMVLTASPTLTLSNVSGQSTPTAAGSNGTCTGSGNTNCTITITTNSTTTQVIQAITANITAGITNPTGAGVYYVIITTKNAGTAIDTQAVAFNITTGQAVSVTVDPTLSFSITNLASGQTLYGSTNTSVDISSTPNAVGFGNISGGTAYYAGQTLNIGTNAAHGYTVYTRYTQQLQTTGADLFADASGTNASPAAFNGSGSTSAFGYYTSGPGETQFTNTLPWAKFTTTNAAIATSTSPVASQNITFGYALEASNAQKAGAYTTTVIFTATPTY